MAWMAGAGPVVVPGRFAKGGPILPGKGMAAANGGAAQKQQDWGIPGLHDKMMEVFGIAVGVEPNIESIISKIETKVQKLSDKYAADERAKQRGTVTQAKIVIEELVENLMSSICGPLYEKEWLAELDFTPVLVHIASHTFENAKMFTRMLLPHLTHHVGEALYKYQEEERITKAIWESIQASGIPQSHQKKATQHLTKSYDDAHFKSPYGSTPADSEELSILQDFVKGWMIEFCGRSWDVIESGVGATDRDSQVTFMTGLFQTLCDPGVNCLPYEITNSLGGLPAAPWQYLEECAGQVIDEVSAAQSPAAKRQRIG